MAAESTQLTESIRLIEGLNQRVREVGERMEPILWQEWKEDWGRAMQDCEVLLDRDYASGIIERLREIKGAIEEHNRQIERLYLEAISFGFTRCSRDVQEEVVRLKAEGHMLVGYKWVIQERAAEMERVELDWEKKVVGPTGASRGLGFYTTTNFATALGFAKLAARYKAAVSDPSLVEPQEPADQTDVVAMRRFIRAGDEFKVREEEFEQEEWKEYGVVVRVYCQDLFAMNGLFLEDGRGGLPDDWKSYDYIDGRMDGGGEREWEIKFNRKKDVFTKIRVCTEVTVDVWPDLPRGVRVMLEAARAFAAKDLEGSLSAASASLRKGEGRDGRG